jgi:hypothetical protein
MGEHGEDSAVAILALGQVELHQDVAHVSFDRALAEVEALCDAVLVKPSAMSSSTSRSRSESSASGSSAPGLETSLATTCGSSADPPRATRSAVARNSPTSGRYCTLACKCRAKRSGRRPAGGTKPTPIL